MNLFAIIMKSNSFSLEAEFGITSYSVLASATSDNKDELVSRFANSLTKMKLLKDHQRDVVRYEFLG